MRFRVCFYFYQQKVKLNILQLQTKICRIGIIILWIQIIGTVFFWMWEYVANLRRLWKKLASLFHSWFFIMSFILNKVNSCVKCFPSFYISGIEEKLKFWDQRISKYWSWEYFAWHFFADTRWYSFAKKSTTFWQSGLWNKCLNDSRISMCCYEANFQFVSSLKSKKDITYLKSKTEDKW